MPQHAVSLFDTMPLGVVFQDASGTIVSANPAAERILGLSLDEMRGLTSSAPQWRAVREDGSEFPGEAHPVMVALRTGKPVKGVVMGVRQGKGDRDVWIRIDAVPCFKPGAETPYAAYATFEDVTEQKVAQEELRASEHRLRLANEVANIGTYDLDPRTGTVHWSKLMCGLYGVEEGTVRSFEDWVELVDVDDRTRLRREHRRSLDPSGDGWVRAEHRARTPDGTERHLSWLGRTFFEDDGCGTRVPSRQLGVVMDISARVEAAALRDAARRKDDFLALLSHELRNPLSPILNGVYLLEHSPPGGEQARRALAIIDRQSRQLSKLVDDLLDVTRLTRGKLQLHLRTVDLNELVHASLEDHRLSFEQAGVHLELDSVPGRALVKADGNRLSQVVGNLLQNALKFTGRGGRVRVSLSVSSGQRQAAIEVADTGVGIAPEMLTRIFEPFAQADTTLSRGPGGLGLGLAIVRGLVEQHGGAVSAHSAGPGAGTEIVVLLPLEASDEQSPALPTSSKRTVRRRVLIIEDNEDAAETLRQVLELGHHDVTVAYSGPEGLERARQLHPDVVICDLGLPGMNGFEVARAIRADKGLESTMLAALTGYSQPQDVESALKAGFDRHMAKPPSIERLHALLAEAPRRVS